MIKDNERQLSEEDKIGEERKVKSEKKKRKKDQAQILLPPNHSIPCSTWWPLRICSRRLLLSVDAANESENGAVAKRDERCDCESAMEENKCAKKCRRVGVETWMRGN